MRTLFGLVDLISPDLTEARDLTGRTAPSETMDALLGWGARVVGLRMGARGFTRRIPRRRHLRIPAVPTLCRTTGAGDAYIGGFLVGLGEGVDAAEAGARAAVSASFAIEQFGVPDFGPAHPARGGTPSPPGRETGSKRRPDNGLTSRARSNTSLQTPQGTW